MKVVTNAATFFLAMAFALCLDIPDKLSPDMAFVSEAEAIIGAPFTPLSYAGVARRTTRRAIYAASSEAYATEAAAPKTSTTPPPSTATSAPPPPSPQYSAVPTGTIVTSLPKGCQTVDVDGANYYDCAGTFYKAAFQGNNLVYVVVERPVK